MSSSASILGRRSSSGSVWIRTPEVTKQRAKAVAYRGDKKIGEDFVRTAGECAAVTATRDPYSDENDEFVFYRLAAVDAKGVLCPWEDREVEISVSGAGEFAAAGNGNPHDRTGFSSKRQRLFYGRAMVAVRCTGPGEIMVKAVLCQ